MTAPAPALVIFLGGLGESPVEEMVGGARVAASLDTVDAALQSGAFSNVILVTDGRFPLPPLPGGVSVDAGGGPYHFGSRLAEVVRQHKLGRVVYLGGGSLPLLGSGGLAEAAEALAEDGVVVTNNYYSSDMVGFAAEALVRVHLPERDNRLARSLSEEAGLTVRPMERTVASQFDIDSPTDLAVLAVTGEGGPRLRRCVASLGLDVERYRRVLPLFCDRSAEISVAGRVGSHAWQYLERETACRVRLFAEERGMEADGRAAAGEARSLPGFLLEEVGPQRFFKALAELGDAAIIDSRVLLAHFHVDATRSDRFLSDLGRWPEVSDPFLRDFTRAAVEAPTPVLLGGHSLVSGGLMALNEFAWRQRESAAD